MGTLSTTSPMRYARLCLFFVVIMRAAAQTIQATSALSTPLFLPTSIAFDAQGNLYFAETNHHVIRKVDTTGKLTTVAGDGSQGFSGDGGAATSAQLDSPAGIVLDAANNLYVADTHNHRVRALPQPQASLLPLQAPAPQASPATAAQPRKRLAACPPPWPSTPPATSTSPTSTTIASANLPHPPASSPPSRAAASRASPATAAPPPSPPSTPQAALPSMPRAISSLADTRNHRIRVVRAATGIITTLAGTGTPAFSGDNAAATSATLALPRGISIDAAGNVILADSNNQRIRRISASGIMTTIAGDGTQALAGDGGPALSASLDTPRGTAFSAAGLATLADTGNQRVRQVQADATIQTIAGPGAIAAGSLTLTVPSTVVYGTGSLTATLASSTPATGSITFVDNLATGTISLASVPLVSGAATFSTASLAAGTHRLSASYPGDLTHDAAQSATTLLTVSPAPLTATIAPLSILYGQAIPPLSGTFSGVLPQDSGNVSLALTTTAIALSPTGSYPITAALTGPAAGNYTLPPLSTTLTIAKAPSTATLSAAAQSATVGQPVALTLHVASTTSGTPTGTVALLDGGAPLASLPLSTSGDAMYTTSTLTAGTHTLTAIYPGDGNFTPSTTAAQTIVITNIIPADFTLAATGPTSQTVTAGSSAAFPFTVQMQGGALSSPITLAASSLPAGVTASFSPAYLPPGGAITAFTLTLQTSKAAATASLLHTTALTLAVLFLPWLAFSAPSRRLLTAGLSLMLLVSATGCGARVFAVGSAASLSGTSYPITVSGTATGSAGTPLVHTVTVTLNVQ